MNKEKRDAIKAWAVMLVLCLGFWLYILKLIRNL